MKTRVLCIVQSADISPGAGGLRGARALLARSRERRLEQSCDRLRRLVWRNALRLVPHDLSGPRARVRTPVLTKQPHIALRAMQFNCQFEWQKIFR